MLFAATVGTRVVAVLMCGFGILVPQLPWTLIGVMWVYVVARTVPTDLAKLAYFRFAARALAPTPLTAHDMPRR